MVDTKSLSQIELALWRRYATAQSDASSIPTVLRHRLHSLLCPSSESLRADEMERAADSDDEFGLGDVYALAVGLDLLDLGFSPRHAAFLQAYLRPELDRWLELSLHRLSVRSRVEAPAERVPNLPVYEKDGTVYVDARVFIVLQKLEPRTDRPPPKSGCPFIREPVFCEGVNGLRDAFADLMPNPCRTLSVMEIIATAQAVRGIWDSL